MFPRETQHPTTRLFYDREVLRGGPTEPIPLHAVLGPAAVVAVGDWATARPLALCGDDVFVCESEYREADKTFSSVAVPLAVAVPAARPPRETLAIEAAELRRVQSPFVLLEVRSLFMFSRILYLFFRSTLLLAPQISVLQQEHRKQMDSTRRADRGKAQALREVLQKGGDGDGAGTGRSEKARGPSAYVIFCNQQRPVVSAKHPGTPFKEIGHMLREQVRWRGLFAMLCLFVNCF